MKQFSIGDEVIVIQNTSSHNYKIGKKYTIHDRNVQNNRFRLMDKTKGTIGNYIIMNDMKILNITVEQLEEEIDNSMQEINDKKIMINYIKENKLESINGTETKAIKMLSRMNADINKDSIKKVLNILDDEYN